MASEAIQIKDNSPAVLQAFQIQIEKALEDCGQLAEGYSKAKAPKDTGQLQNSITHKVVMSEKACYIGSNLEYAAYVECGTGVYYGGGRKTPWTYQDKNGNWHITNGQRAVPYLRPAVADHGAEYKEIVKHNLKR